MENNTFVVRGNICDTPSLGALRIVERGYIVVEDGVCRGVFESLPEQYEKLPMNDYGEKLIIPGLVDLHTHAPQYTFRSLGMDLELLEWLEVNTFPEEAKYRDIDYAKKAYEIVAEKLKYSGTTRACLFATVHKEATIALMDFLEASGLVTMVGKVNMDRNAPDYLLEASADASIRETIDWLEEIKGRYRNTTPILTPRFIPSCTDALMEKLHELQKEYHLPLQSHLSENQGEIAWVQELCPKACGYGDAYDRFGTFGSDGATIMAHCVYSDEEERALMKERGVMVAHCPQSNTNLASGIAPIRKFLDEGLNVGLGSDVAGAFTESIFRAMSDAVQVSKLYWRLVDQNVKPLTIEEVLYLATKGGGAFFGKVGSFEEGYEFDALVLNDETLKTPLTLTVKERLDRLIYLAEDNQIEAKFVRGRRIF